ncbi:MAG TPA: hypothetical protein VIH59_29315 [Candidatus Tectomicrobia bacterium]
MTISTSANPADGWRAIAPVGDLAGLPLSDVGLEWEASNAGWNSNLTFDDSPAAGWQVPVSRDVAQFGGTSTNNIWSDGPDGAGNTPTYFRKIFVLNGQPSFASFGSSIPEDYSNVVDDDMQIYINGQLVFNDQDGVATFIPVTDVTGFLHAGPNLLAVKAHDSAGGFEHFSLILSISGVSFAAFPATVTLVLGSLTNDDAFQVQGTFTLGDGSNGIDPLTEAVTVRVGTSALTIPAGAFHRTAAGAFEFAEVLEGVTLQVMITPLTRATFEVVARGEGAALSGIAVPVAVGLTIGDDSGSTALLIAEVNAQRPPPQRQDISQER